MICTPSLAGAWRLLSILFSLLLLSACASQPQLIPRDVLFGNPERTAVRLSPDGRYISWLAPSDQGVLNVWIRPREGGKARQVTHDTHRGIRRYFWAEESRTVLYLQDKGGDENFHLYGVEITSGAERDLTPYEGVRVSELFSHRDHPDTLLVGLNKRDRRVFDIYRLDLRTGEIYLDTLNPGNVDGWHVGPDFEIHAAVTKSLKDGGSVLLVRESRTTPWRELIHWPFGENGSVVGFNASGDHLFVTSSLDSDTTRLVELDARSGRTVRVLAHDSRVDVGDVLMDEVAWRVQAVSFHYERKRWEVLDPALEEDFERLRRARQGNLSIVSRTHDDRLWMVAYSSDVRPLTYWLYDRNRGEVTFLLESRPALGRYRLQPMEPVVIRAGDGLELLSYLTRPAYHPEQGRPLVLYVHGGPWARDYWGFDATAQWLANRGYGVLQVNYRGSTGFGKRFLNAGNGEWGTGRMQQDLTDAVNWVVEQGIADRDKVCIFGGSYGGYATLAGLTFTPELYRCGVDLVGPSHIRTLFESIPDYWELFRRELVLRVGDVENDPELDRRISPLFHVDRIRAPLMIGQGANDPRVNIREAEQMVEAMRSRGLPVEYIVYTDEGHGFARPANRLDFFGRMERFLARHLGGRAEPFQPMEGSSASER
ncbi:MAG TPA: S9 family peptidase [Thiotrichales bacterium]|nr:S9 family peptidase [Thiotrichales bacterium]